MTHTLINDSIRAAQSFPQDCPDSQITWHYWGGDDYYQSKLPRSEHRLSKLTQSMYDANNSWLA